MAEVVVQSGDTVEVHFSGFDEEGENVHSSLENGPLRVCLGQGRLIAGLEAAMIGMVVGEAKTLLIEAADAFTNPEHPLHGKDIIYELKILSLEKTQI